MRNKYHYYVKYFNFFGITVERKERYLRNKEYTRSRRALILFEGVLIISHIGPTLLKKNFGRANYLNFILILSGKRS